MMIQILAIFPCYSMPHKLNIPNLGLGLFLHGFKQARCALISQFFLHFKLFTHGCRLANQYYIRKEYVGSNIVSESIPTSSSFPSSGCNAYMSCYFLPFLGLEKVFNQILETEGNACHAFGICEGAFGNVYLVFEKVQLVFVKVYLVHIWERVKAARLSMSYNRC